MHVTHTVLSAGFAINLLMSIFSISAAKFPPFVQQGNFTCAYHNDKFTEKVKISFVSR